MNKKKILFTIGSLNMGGAEKVLVNYINYFKANFSSEFEVELFLISYEGALLKELDKNINTSYLYKGNNFINNLNPLSKAIYKLIRKILYLSFLKFPVLFNTFFSKYSKFDYNFIFVQDLYWFSKTNFGIKKYLWIQNNLNKVRDNHLFENLDFTANIDHIVSISDGICDDLINRLCIHPSRIIKCYNPIDSVQITKLSNEEVDTYFEVPYMISMGRLVDQKGFDILLEALSLLRRENIFIKLIIVGGGERYFDLLEQAKILNLVEGVDFVITGLLANPYPLIKNSKIFVCSSRFDGLSTSINEAMSLSVPIVSTPCDYGPKEIIGDNYYGLLSREISSKSLKVEIKRMLEDDDLLNKYSQLSLIRSNDFDIMNVGKRLINTL